MIAIIIVRLKRDFYCDHNTRHEHLLTDSDVNLQWILGRQVIDYASVFS